MRSHGHEFSNELHVSVSRCGCKMSLLYFDRADDE